MDVDQLDDIEELFKETEKAKQKFRQEYKEEKKFEELVQKQQKPVVEAIKATVKKAEESSIKLSLEESDEELVEKILTVTREDYDVSPPALKSLMINLYKQQQLPVLITLLKQEREFRPVINSAYYRNHGTDILVFYGLGGSNVNMDFDRLMKSKTAQDYLEFLDQYTEANGEAIIRLYEDMEREDDDDDDEDDEDDTMLADIFDDSSDAETASYSGDALNAREAPLSNTASHSGDGLRYYKDPQQLTDRLLKLHATYKAGNTATEVFNEANTIAKELLQTKKISKEKYQQMMKLFS